jgi:DNA-directed RNA polymerase subunit RPC12/RpoP
MEVAVMVVRQCAKCGTADTSRHWSSLAEAGQSDSAASGWACPNCGSPEAEFVETSGTSDPAPDQADPYAPVDPDEAKRTVGGMNPR